MLSIFHQLMANNAEGENNMHGETENRRRSKVSSILIEIGPAGPIGIIIFH
jgi:hypothetical protein